ncbi:MAG: glycosyltransferase family 2 protein [Candidatus Omnitrophica bacterium]|nr:glycosyltransferase family 2 protein [Candidatus Omnitrophota bacterium]
MPPLISIIVPVYNEVDTIIQILEAVNAVNIDKEIIVVDDGSADGTANKLSSLDYSRFNNLKVIHHSSNMGKGAAILTGLSHASGEFVIIQDADLEYNPQEYIPLVNYARANNLAVVYGSRFLSGRCSMSRMQYLANKVLTFAVNILFFSSLTDMETCFKLVRREALAGLNLKARRFEIEPEITIKLLKKGYKIKEIPVSYKRRSYAGGKKIKWSDGIQSLCTIFKLRMFF